MVLIVKVYKKSYRGAATMFPSPYGDYGSYLTMTKKEAIRYRIEFPSPYGDYGSYRL